MKSLDQRQFRIFILIFLTFYAGAGIFGLTDRRCLELLPNISPTRVAMVKFDSDTDIKLWLGRNWSSTQTTKVSLDHGNTP